MQCARHNTGCGVACSMPPRIRTGVPELNGVAFATTGAVWHMTQSPFGRLRCDMCIYPRESKRAGNGVKTGGFVRGKAGWEGRQFLHTCKSGVARESLSGTAQHEHAGAAQPVSVTLHSGTPPPGPGDRLRGILDGDSGAGRIRIRKRGASGFDNPGEHSGFNP